MNIDRRRIAQVLSNSNKLKEKRGGGGEERKDMMHGAGDSLKKC